MAEPTTLSEETIRRMLDRVLKAKGDAPEFAYIAGRMFTADGVEVCPRCCKRECQCE